MDGYGSHVPAQPKDLDLNDAPARASQLFLIDGNSLGYRAFYALPEELATSDGFPTNALLGFANMLVRLLGDYRPRGVLVAWDERPTHRLERFPGYKATRKPTPDLLRQQQPYFRPLVEAFGYRNVSLEGHEADDVIGTLATRAEAAGIPTCVISHDRDAFQLVSPHVSVLLSPRGVTDVHVYTPERVEARYGIPPALVPDFLGLKGDPSDDIPGIPGVGDKTASDLLVRFGSLEGIYANLPAVPGEKRRETLAAHRDDAFTSRALATIERDLPIDIDPADLIVDPPDRAGLKEMFRRFEFRALLRRIDELDEAVPAAEQDSESIEVQVVEVDEPALAAFLAGAQEAGVARVEDGRYAVATGGRVALAAIAPEQLARLLTPLETTRARLQGRGRRARGLRRRAGLRRGDRRIPARSGSCRLPRRRSARGAGARSHDRRVRGRSRRDPRRRLGRRPALGPRAAAGRPRDGRRPPPHRAAARPRALLDGARGHRDRHRADGRDRGQGLRALRGARRRGRTSWRAPSSRSAAPKQLGEVLFERLGLPAGRKGKTGYSTDQRVLSRIRELHPIVPVIEEWRELSKLLSTYLVPFPELIGDDGRLHTTFSQTTAATGRLSANRPNLQNIPVRTEVGRQIRETFIAPDGSRLVSADYSQVELRILANLSGEELLLDAFARGDDIHAVTAAEVLGKDQGELTRDERNRAKAVNFGIVYGISSFGLSDQLDISREEAQSYIDTYRGRMPRVAEWIARAIEDARERGYSVTMLGRRRPIPELRAGNWQVRSLGERLAVNSVIQGTAADIIKLAMIRVHRRLRDEGRAGKLVLQIHDELLLEVPEVEVPAVRQLVREEMIDAFPLEPPLGVDVGVGRDWLSAKS